MQGRGGATRHEVGWHGMRGAAPGTTVDAPGTSVARAGATDAGVPVGAPMAGSGHMNAGSMPEPFSSGGGHGLRLSHTATTWADAASYARRAPSGGSAPAAAGTAVLTRLQPCSVNSQVCGAAGANAKHGRMGFEPLAPPGTTPALTVGPAEALV